MSYHNFYDCNQELTDRQFQCGTTQINQWEGELCFTLKTMYPGLLVGIGNIHEAGIGVGGQEKDGAEIKLGFTLDYVTGLPVIPGSTVKGVLHSIFKLCPEYVAMQLGIDTGIVKNIESSVFTEATEKIVFFDSIPIQAGKNEHLFALEYITPHPQAWKNPIPLTMLKIIPNVVFLFRFGFWNWKDTEGITGQKLKNAFRAILCDLGIGAKTNVGFGALESVDVPEPYFYLEVKERTQIKRAVQCPVCSNVGCNNPVKQKKDGGFYHYCWDCNKKHYVSKGKGKI
jgi:CRISPR-associated protein Cmr6